MFLSTNTCDGKRDCILLVEYVIETVRTEQYSAIFMEDMLWTGLNVMAVECVCTIVLQTI